MIQKQTFFSYQLKKMIESHKDYIKQETLSKKLIEEDKDSTHLTDFFEMDNIEIGIGIEKA